MNSNPPITAAETPDSSVGDTKLKRPLNGIAQEIDQGFKELKAMLAGDLEGIPIQDFINELKAEQQKPD